MVPTQLWGSVSTPSLCQAAIFWTAVTARTSPDPSRSAAHTSSTCCPELPPGWSPSRRPPRLTVRCLDSKGPCALRCTSQPPCEVGTVPLASKEEPDSETLRSMPKVTQLVNGRGKSGPGLSPLSATADEPACAEVATALQTGWEGRPEVREELLPNEEIPFSFSLKKRKCPCPFCSL